MENKGRVLVVEDESINLELLQEILRSSGYRTLGVADGESAWDLLSAEGDFLAVLLDRQLPDMDGLELLRRIKAEGELLHLPVILQTSMDSREDVLEGLRSGAAYYLTKPVEAETLLAIVKTAVGDHLGYKNLREQVALANKTLGNLEQAEFSFRTTREAGDIASLLARACPNPSKVVVGLSELMFNAVEHGNLEIGYKEKSTLIDAERFHEEIETRLKLPRFARRKARIRFERGSGELRFWVEDEGPGFAWSQYMTMSPDRVFDTHGRGIAMAAVYSFDSLEYQGRGNQVLASVSHDVEE